MAKDVHSLGLNPFGACLWEHMQERGITSWQELAELVSAHGYEVSAEQFREWMYDAPDVMRATVDDR
jgi:hypothetical protein